MLAELYNRHHDSCPHCRPRTDKFKTRSKIILEDIKRQRKKEKREGQESGRWGAPHTSGSRARRVHTSDEKDEESGACAIPMQKLFEIIAALPEEEIKITSNAESLSLVTINRCSSSTS